MIGNLSLLPSRFNVSLSNSEWAHKRQSFEKHSTELLNSQIAQTHDWTDSSIEQRTSNLTERILTIWPAPSDLPNRSATVTAQTDLAQISSISLADLVEAQLLSPGDELTWQRANRGDEYRVVISADSRLETTDGQVFKSPSEAATRLTGSSYNGWVVWIVASTGQTLDEKRTELIQLMTIPPETD
jgi:hypothetical protein